MIFSQIWTAIKEVMRRMSSVQGVEQSLGISSAVSSKMTEAIELWDAMYKGEAPWLSEEGVKSLGLPSFIASEKARMAVLEMQSTITCPTVTEESIDEETQQPVETDVPVGGIERAEFLNENYKVLLKDIRRQLEYGIAKGGLVIKPYVILTESTQITEDTTQQKDMTDSSGKTNGQVFQGQDEKEEEDKKKSKELEDETEGEEDTKKPKPDSEEETEEPENGEEVAEEQEGEQSLIQYAGKFGFEFVQADGFYPISFDSSGKLTEAAFVEKIVRKDDIFSRVEYHKLEGTSVTIINKAYKSIKTDSDIDSDLGTPILLTDVPEWADLQEETTIVNVDRLLFAYFKMPEANTVDTYSPLGVSAYSRAVSLIEQADRQYSRLLWEYEGGELAIDVDQDALRVEKNSRGEAVERLPQHMKRLFRKLDLGSDETYKPYNPTLRDANYIDGLNEILMRIEDVCQLSRGTIANVTQEARTATELKILKQRSYAANKDIQDALEDTLEDVVYIMNTYSTLYQLCPEGLYATSYEWDDSILVDTNEELGKKITLMQNKLMSRVELRMWYFGETKAQALTALAEIDSGTSEEESEESQVGMGFGK